MKSKPNDHTRNKVRKEDSCTDAEPREVCLFVDTGKAILVNECIPADQWYSADDTLLADLEVWR